MRGLQPEQAPVRCLTHIWQGRQLQVRQLHTRRKRDVADNVLESCHKSFIGLSDDGVQARQLHRLQAGDTTWNQQKSCSQPCKGYICESLEDLLASND